MKVFMFPGQGSQVKGMGQNLFDEFSDYTEIADQVLGYSIKELCLTDPKGALNDTKYTQPALFVVNALNYFGLRNKGCVTDYLLGHSLGEFNALLSADCFGFADGLKMVKRRGELMSQATDGAMAAVIGASENNLLNILQENGLSNVDLANFNTPSQIVISGKKSEIESACHLLDGKRITCIRLKTSGAFHSRYMKKAQKDFEAYLSEFHLNEPAIPVISNVSARPYESSIVAINLGNQISNPVKWSESIQYLLAVAKHKDSNIEFIEVGHGNVLTNLVAKIKVETKLSPMISISEECNSHREALKINVYDKVDQWNSNYSVGTKIKIASVSNEVLITRTDAMVLFGRRAVLFVCGKDGYFSLDEVAVV